MNLADVVPDGDELVALEPKELGLRILQVLATWSPHISQIRLGLFLNGGAQTGYSSYSRGDQIGRSNKRGVGVAWKDKGCFCKDPATCREICAFAS